MSVTQVTCARAHAHGVSVDGEAFRLGVEMRGTTGWWVVSFSSSWQAPGQKEETWGGSVDANQL